MQYKQLLIKIKWSLTAYNDKNKNILSFSIEYWQTHTSQNAKDELQKIIFHIILTKLVNEIEIT